MTMWDMSRDATRGLGHAQPRSGRVVAYARGGAQLARPVGHARLHALVGEPLPNGGAFGLVGRGLGIAAPAAGVGGPHLRFLDAHLRPEPEGGVLLDDRAPMHGAAERGAI